MSNGNRVTVYLDVDPNNTGRNALNNLSVEINQFTQNVTKATNSASGSLGSYLERFAIRQLLFAATRDVEHFFESSIKAAKEAYKAEQELNGAIIATGQSYRVASEAAESYRNLTQSTHAQANQATAATAQVASRAGLTSASDVRVERAVADLVAGQGGGAADATKALQKLAEGNNEVIQKLTGKSAAEVEKTYALLHDKLPQDLLPFEKELARVNAIIEQSKLFTGEAANHLDTVAGRIETAADKWHDFEAGVGDAILSSAQLKDALDAIVSVLGILPDAAHKGFRSVEEAAKEAVPSELSLKGIINRIWGGGSQLVYQAQSLLHGSYFTEEGRAIAKASDEEYNRIVYGRDAQAAGEQQAATNREIRNRQVRELKEAGISQQDIYSIFQQAGQYQGEARETFIEDQITAIKKVYEAKNAERIKDQQQDEQDEQKRLQHAKELARQQVEAMRYVSDLGAKLHADNPYVKLFEAAETVADRMREKFGLLSADVIKQITTTEQKVIELETYSQRLKTSLSAVQLEFKADELQKNLVGITAEQERQLGILQKQFAAATQAPALRREAEAYRTGFLPQNEFQLRQDEMRDYENVKRLRPQGSDEAARTAQKLIDDYILQQTKNLPITARFSSDFFTRELGQDRAGALEASAKRLQAEIQDEIKRAEAGRSGIELANRELAELVKHPPGSGAERDVYRADFLKITDKLNPNELTGAMRQAVIFASREEAQYQRAQEKEASDFRKALVGSGGILYQIRDAIQGKATTGDKSGSWFTRHIPGLSLAQQGVDNSDVLRISAKPAYDSKDAYEAAHAAADKRERETANNYFTNDNSQGYDPRLNQITDSGDASDQDEKLNALMRAHAEGHFFGDPVAFFTAGLKRVGDPVEVNPYSQAFFRARPGYSPANDPRVFDAMNPYQQSFLHAGYLDSLRSSAYEKRNEKAPLSKSDFVEVLNSLVENGRLKVDAGKAATINVTTKDPNVQIMTLGAAMSP